MLTKTPININFRKGLETKTDPYQVPAGSFLALKNSVFTKTGRLTKRNGYSNVVADLPNADQTILTSLNDNLIATGTNLYSYNQDIMTWQNKGIVQPVQLATQSLIRASTGQSAPDMAIAPNNLVCLTYKDTDGFWYYQVTDGTTGANVTTKTLIASTAFDARVVVVGVYFVITFIALIAGTNRLRYIALPINEPTMAGTVMQLSADVNASFPAYDVSVANNFMYFAWNASTANIHAAYLTNSLTLSAVYTEAGKVGERIAVYADPLTNTVWVLSTHNVINGNSAIALDLTLTPIMAPTVWGGGGSDNPQLTIIARGRTVFAYRNNPPVVFYGTAKTGSFTRDQVTLPVAGVGPGTTSTISNFIGAAFASKPFLINTRIYILAAYGNMNNTNSADNSNQPSYFLLDEVFNVYMRLAYSNGGGYPQTQVVPQVTLIDGTYSVPYQIVDFLTSTNKTTNLAAGTPTNAIYTQTGINKAAFTLNSSGQYSSEIASALHLTGGQLWEYDGLKPVELGFHIWPENILATPSTTGGTITAGTYFYVFTYEWTDNVGNLHRSAPSIPYKVVTTGSTSSVVIDVPMLQLTAKTSPNPVRIVGYRWSVNQQIYYQFTSVTNPVINVVGSNFATITDTQPDSAILGNTLLYTTGDVVENIAPPASIASAMFKNRLFLVDAEDQNLLWFSKVVIENVPVEFSDLFTIYVAPTTGAQGSTGPITAISAMDDKLIVFKRDAIYYITGAGPDNTGANNDFSDPIYITSSVGCINPKSIVLMPNGLMFQSDKGIWMLGRDLSTNYIGDRVEQYNDSTVMSAQSIPGTNQVRFILNNGVTLMYDYYFNEWATHSNVEAISATLYHGLDTYLNSLGQVYQETVNTYTDGSAPVLMSLTTSWFNIAGLQGYERFYFMYLLGTYYSPFKLNVELAYDYNPSPQQSTVVIPDNNNNFYGDEALWGSGEFWGGKTNVFEARIFPTIQKCSSFQVTITESYDVTLDQAPGQGLSLSGLNLVVGMKKGYRTQTAKRSFG